MSGASNEGFFGATLAAFDRAAARADVREVFLDLAGHIILLRFASPPMAQALLPALAVRNTASAPAELTICVWDERSTGVSIPPSPWPPADPRLWGNARAKSSGLQVRFDVEQQMLSVLSADGTHAIAWARDAGDLPPWERAAPLRTLLHWWSARQGLQMTHGAAVGERESGVILAGRGGSGKSTAALASLSGGMLYAGDDYILTTEAPQPRAFNLYGTAKLEQGQAIKLPELAAARQWDRQSNDSGKLTLDLAETFHSRIAASLPLAGILAVRIGSSSRSRLLPASPVEILASLAPSTLFQLPQSEPKNFLTLSRLVRKLPGATLESGHDLSTIPAAIREFLKEPERFRH